MSISLHDNTADLVTIGELQIFLLLFADDTVIFSYCKFYLISCMSTALNGALW